MEAKTPVDALADVLVEEKGVTQGETLGYMEIETLIKALANMLTKD